MDLPNRPLYLDFAATTPVDPRVAELVCHLMTEEFGNAGSRTHVWGTEAKKLVERAREEVAAVVEAAPEEVIFTSGATESNNLALLGLAEYGLAAGKRHIISSEIEHKAVLEPLQELQRRGFEVTLLPPNSGGWVPPEEVARALRPDTLLVSIMQVNNETGIIQPIAEVCEALRDHTAFFHMDAAQGFGKELTAPRLKRVDLISLSGHKIYAPKGIGALITRRRRFKRPPLRSLMFGGGQEFGLRPGTQPVPLIAGLGLAGRLAIAEHDERVDLCIQAERLLTDSLKRAGFHEVGERDRRIHCIAAYWREGLDSEFTMMALRDVCSISNGAACSSSQYKASHVFESIPGLSEQAESVVRLSWAHTTNANQVAGLNAALNFR